MQITRRVFSQAAAAGTLLAAGGGAEVALLTHAEGAHLGAYLEGLAATTEVDSVCLCDPEGRTLEQVKKALGGKFVTAYRSPQELFRARKPVLALVTMEARLAPPVIDAALTAGVHVLAEKPGCVRVEDFEPLARKAISRDRQLMLALANRLDPVMREARRLVESGAIGRVYGVELHTIADQTRLRNPEYQKGWFADKARGGGGHLIWLGIHWLDLAMFLTGSSIAQVAGFIGNAGGQPINVEDSAVVSFRFVDGTLGNLTSGYYLDRDKQLFIKVWGSDGWLEVNHHTERPLEWHRNGEPGSKLYEPPPHPPGYTACVRHCVRAALGLEQPMLTPGESLRVLRTVFAGYEAARTGRTQTVVQPKS